MIVIHCTATRADRPLSPAELTKMHRKRGFKCCGYHYFVRTDGQGQPADTRTELQKRSLRILVRVLKSDFPAITQVVGHRDLSPDLDGDGTVEPEEWTKACPCFDVKKEL